MTPFTLRLVATGFAADPLSGLETVTAVNPRGVGMVLLPLTMGQKGNMGVGDELIVAVSDGEAIKPEDAALSDTETALKLAEIDLSERAEHITALKTNVSELTALLEVRDKEAAELRAVVLADQDAAALAAEKISHLQALVQEMKNAPVIEVPANPQADTVADEQQPSP